MRLYEMQGVNPGLPGARQAPNELYYFFNPNGLIFFIFISFGASLSRAQDWVLDLHLQITSIRTQETKWGAGIELRSAKYKVNALLAVVSLLSENLFNVSLSNLWNVIIIIEDKKC